MAAVHYVVKPGDTLSEIALHFYGDGNEPFWRRIYNANKTLIGPDPNLIKPGEDLVIPFPSHLPAHYVVKAGDTLSGIALHFYGNGTEPFWKKIYDANKTVIGSNPNVIKPGENLVIPVL
jgi:nucleoid-associated protein YgaU